MNQTSRTQQLLASGLALLLVASLVTSVSFIATQPARAQSPTPINSCTTITSSGEYVLTQDITNSSATTCIDIQASDVVFDGNGHTVDGIDGSGTKGVYSGSQTNVTVKNTAVSDWTRGVEFNASVHSKLINDTASSNLAGVLLTYHSNNNTLTNITTNNNELGTYLNFSDDNTLTGITANDNTVRGFTIGSSSNNSIANSVANNNDIGVYLFLNSNNTLTNVTTNNNHNYGVLVAFDSNNNTLVDTTANNNGVGINLGNSANNTLTNTTATNNTNEGILLDSSANSRLTNTTATNNGGVGIYLGNSTNSRLTNTTTANNPYGIYLYGSINSRLTNTTTANNPYGIYLDDAQNNTLTNGTITANTNAGIFLDGDSANNLIYNNLLNNTQNVNFTAGFTNASNTWNVSNQTGPNIIGGPNLGGNYYATPAGDGFSQTCTDANNDGFCDTPNDFGVDNNNTDFLPLTGQPNISVSPSSVDFGSVPVGDTVIKNVTITNTGTASLNITNTSISGPDTGEFTIVNGSAPFSLAAGESHNVTVQFTPTSADAKNASLAIESNDPDTPTVSVPLSGTGTQQQHPDIKVSPHHLNFGHVKVGHSKTRKVTIRNTGTGPLNVSATTISGPDASSFNVVSGGAPFTLAPGERRHARVQFTPTSKGTKHATLTIESNDPDEPTVNVGLCGKGTKNHHKTAFPHPLIIRKHGKVLFKIGPPRDLNHDGLYEDVNGDHKFTFKDVIALAIIENAYQHGHLYLNRQQIAALDFNHDVKLTQKDVGALAIDLFKSNTGWHSQLKDSDLNKDGTMTARDRTLGRALLNGRDLVKMLSVDRC